MDFYPKYRTRCLAVFLISLHIYCIYTEELCNNADLRRRYGIGLSESQFWRSKSQDFEQCAKLCIRQKMCRSITFDTQSNMCEMNSGTLSDTPKRTEATLVYSEFNWWPSSVRINMFCLF